ncbi:MAG: S8 family serine peptidase [Planctomycetia bacterium]|nr:S8 family serine peptidase [Planctomycetia bacterium]
MPTPTWGLEAIGAERDGPHTGRGVRIAVLDTGIDRKHPAFAGLTLDIDRNVRNFTRDTVEDTNGHGTHCAATIFGRDVDGYRIGVARGVTDVLIGKVLSANGGGFADIADGLSWAFAEGAHIVSMSLGIDFHKHLTRLRESLPHAEATSQALTDYGSCVRLFDRLCEQLADLNGIYRGMLIIAAAGNESNRPVYAVSVAPPANAFGVVSVGAIGRVSVEPPSLEVARFSNRLPTLCAPGIDVVSARLKGGLKSSSGTSMAAPHVAGVAALYAEQHVAAAPKKFHPQLVLEAMLKGATALPTLAREDVGAGLVRAPE